MPAEISCALQEEFTKVLASKVFELAFELSAAYKLHMRSREQMPTSDLGLF